MKEPVINIGSVAIPLLDYAVSCSAILGIRDSGKTVTAKGIAEQLLEHDIPIVVFDAVGKWRWMKVPGAGPRGRGYKVVVAGGRAPDLALNPHSVGEIVRSAVKEKIPLIIDLYDPALSKTQWRSIVKESIRIIHYESVGVAHVFLEEAAEFIPQKPSDFDTYAEVEKLARMGGNASVGITIISQRAQEVNKAVLDLAVNLILGCQIGSKAIEWIGKWLDRLSPETARAVMKSLPHLKSGEGWVWTRSNPDDPQLEHMPMCRSLHPDRRTPDVALKSAKASDPKEFVERLNSAIPKLIEEAKANDPKELQKTIRQRDDEIRKLKSGTPSREQDVERIKELTEQLQKAKATPSGKPKIVEKKIVLGAYVDRLYKLPEYLEPILIKLMTLQAKFEADRTEVLNLIREAKELNAQEFKEAAPVQSYQRPYDEKRASTSPSAPVINLAKLRHATGARSAASTQHASNGDLRLSSKQQEVLNALAWLETIGITRPSGAQLGAVAMIDTSGGYFSNVAGPLTGAGLIVRGGGVIELTVAGRALAALPERVATLDEYHKMLRARVQRLKSSNGKSLAILNVLITKGGDSMTGAEIGEAVSVDHTGGYFSNSIGPLSTLGLIERSGGVVRPTSILFPPGLF